MKVLQYQANRLEKSQNFFRISSFLTLNHYLLRELLIIMFLLFFVAGLASAKESVNEWETSFLNTWQDEYDENLWRSISEDSWKMYHLSYAIDANISMFCATGNNKYLDRALLYITNLIDKAELSSSFPYSQYKDSYYGWVNHSHIDLGDDGREYPLFESVAWRYVVHLLRIMHDTPRIYNDSYYNTIYNDILSFTEKNIFEKWYTRSTTDNIYRCRAHMAAHWAYIAMELWFITTNATWKPIYKEVFDNINVDGLPNYNNESLRSQLIADYIEDDTYFWSSIWESTAIPGQEVHHGGHVMAYIVEAHSLGIEWTDTDMNRFKNTFNEIVWHADGTWGIYVDGSGSDSEYYSVSQNNGWTKLGRFDEKIQTRLEDNSQTRLNTLVSGNCALNAKILFDFNILSLRFDEASGVIAKDTANFNDGTLINFTSPNCWVAGKYGNALEFDGINDYINCNKDSSLELQEFTYSIWVKPYAIDRSYQQIIGKESIWRKGLFISNNSLRGYVGHSTSGAAALASSVVTTDWQHIAMTYVDNEIKLYRNGVLLSATYTTGVGSVTDLSDKNLLISDTTSPFYGMMDDIRVYSRALSENDINKIYREAPLQLHLNLNESVLSPMANDSSPANNDGILCSFASPDCWVTGKYGNALEFDGINDYVSCGKDSSLELQEFTYSIWVKPYAIDRSYQQIIGKDSIWEKGLFISNNSLRGYVGHSTSGAAAWASSVVTTDWQHIAMTYVDNEIKLYRNGVLLSATYTTGVGSVTDLSDKNLLLSASYPFYGMMDDIRVYSHALSENDINKIYNEAFLQLHFNLNEFNSNPEADDSSSANNDGILINFTSPDCWVAGKYGNALEFDGINDYINCNKNSSLELQEFTYSMWVKPYAIDRSYQQIIGKESIWRKGLFIYNNSLRGYVGHSTSGAAAWASSVVTTDWQHIAMTYVDNEIKLYRNGVLLSATYTTGVGSVTDLSDKNLLISDTTSPFYGMMDDIRVYSRALSEDDINEIYQEQTD